MWNESGDPRKGHYEIFGDPLLASAGLDRLTHRAEVVIIQGTSFRAQGRQRLEEGVLSIQEINS